MSFPIFRLATLAALGWVIYRSFESEKQQGEESRDAGGATPDVSAPGESSAEMADAGAVPEAPATPEPAAPEPAAPEPEPAAQQADDLTRVVGIGPAIARHLNAGGITTWSQLAATEVEALQAILEEAGPRFRIHDPSRWPDQAAELAGAN